MDEVALKFKVDENEADAVISRTQYQALLCPFGTKRKRLRRRTRTTNYRNVVVGFEVIQQTFVLRRTADNKKPGKWKFIIIHVVCKSRSTRGAGNACWLSVVRPDSQRWPRHQD